MNLVAGERLPWPTSSFTTKQSNLLATMDGLLLFRIPTEINIPGLPANIVQRLGIEIIATNENHLTLQQNANCNEGNEWLEQELFRQCSASASNVNSVVAGNFNALLEELHKQMVL